MKSLESSETQREEKIVQNGKKENKKLYEDWLDVIASICMIEMLKSFVGFSVLHFKGKSIFNIIHMRITFFSLSIRLDDAADAPNQVTK